MKRIYHIILVILFLLSSCYDDSSSLPWDKIAEIQVTSNVKDTINLYLGDNISIQINIPMRGMISRGNGVLVNMRRILLMTRLQQFLKKSARRPIWNIKQRSWDIIFFGW